MRNVKQDVESLLNRLPDDVSVEDIQYHLYVLDKVRRGLDDARINGTLSQEEVESRFSNSSPESHPSRWGRQPSPFPYQHRCKKRQETNQSHDLHSHQLYCHAEFMKAFHSTAEIGFIRFIIA
jgi:hypothetical protein